MNPRLSALRRMGATGLRQRLLGAMPDLAAFAGALVSAALAALLLGSLHGCGGGVGGEGTGSFASGPITGFGSIIVNDVRFDDSSAAVVDDDGAAVSSAALALGSVVQVTGGPITTDAAGTATATAQRVQINRAVVGPLGSVDLANGRLVVLGQPVRTTANTVIDPRLAGGLAGLQPGQTVEVHGAYDASTGSFVATRVAPTNDLAWRVRGPVATLDPAGQTFRIGSQTYQYTSATGGDALRDGAQVQVVVQAGGNGQWQVKSPPMAERQPGSGEGTELSGRVSSVLSASRFVVEGVTVDASSARLDGMVRLGALVKVSGTSQGGVLLAREVKVEDEAMARGYSLRGPVTALDSATRRLVVRGTTVSYARPDLVLVKGTLAQLAVGRQLQIAGVLSPDRTVLEATEIRFDD
jgi:Domain of unknown function (DUF5666)